jgi:serine/threonine protein kinase
MGYSVTDTIAALSLAALAITAGVIGSVGRKKTTMMRGGRKLGAGTFGTIYTADEILEWRDFVDGVVFNYVEIPSGNRTSQKMSVEDAASLLEKLGAIFKMANDRSMFDDMMVEHEGNTSFLVSLAKGMQRNKVTATVVDKVSPFLLIDRKRYLVSMSVYDRDKETVFLPVYKRMHTDLSVFVDGTPMTAELVMTAISSILHMLKEMKTVGASHLDLKADNILVNVRCPVGKNKKLKDADFTRLGGCNAEFALSDFGGMLLHRDVDAEDPDEMTMTLDYVSPLIYHTYLDQSLFYERDDFPADFLKKVWDSYNFYVHVYDKKSETTVKKKNPIYAKMKASDKFVKNDLYALGVVILLEFVGDGDKQHSTHLESFAKSLMMGGKGSIWTIPNAMEAFKKVRMSYGNKARQILLT